MDLSKNGKILCIAHCGSMMQGTGECWAMCCGKTIEKLEATQTDENHHIMVSEIDDEFYIEINHEMTKTHFIGFVACVGVDHVLVVRLYPEQDSSV